MNVETKTGCRIVDLGMINYREAYQAQKQAVEEVIGGGEQKLIFCQHPAVLTLGRMTKEGNVLAGSLELDSSGIDVIPVDRGGDVTLHAPGQIVAYPIFDLNNYGRDLHKYLWRLEKVIIDFLNGFGILARREKGKTGVWTEDGKIASIGIGVRKWVSYHGIAVNVNTDLELFRFIRPCGMDIRMTSMKALKGREFDIRGFRQNLVEAFCVNFDVEPVR